MKLSQIKLFLKKNKTFYQKIMSFLVSSKQNLLNTKKSELRFVNMKISDKKFIYYERSYPKKIFGVITQLNNHGSIEKIIKDI